MFKTTGVCVCVCVCVCVMCLIIVCAMCVCVRVCQNNVCVCVCVCVRVCVCSVPQLVDQPHEDGEGGPGEPVCSDTGMLPQELCQPLLCRPGRRCPSISVSFTHCLSLTLSTFYFSHFLSLTLSLFYFSLFHFHFHSQVYNLCSLNRRI